MKTTLQDLTGHQFGRLTVTCRIGTRGKAKHVVWSCVCCCGHVKLITANNLRNGSTQSCGCLNKELMSQRTRTHGLSKTREYRIWRSMHDRCYLKTSRAYKFYGARGITICERWHNFQHFYEDMGPRPQGYSIERKDNNGNYESANCCWIPRSDQMSNTRDTRWLIVNGQPMIMKHAAICLGIHYWTLQRRLRDGFTIEQIQAQIQEV